MTTKNELTATEVLAIEILEDIEGRLARYPLSAAVLQTAAYFGLTTAEVRAIVADAAERMAERA